jgi:hypothetical protein
MVSGFEIPYMLEP